MRNRSVTGVRAGSAVAPTEHAGGQLTVQVDLRRWARLRPRRPPRGQMHSSGWSTSNCTARSSETVHSSVDRPPGSSQRGRQQTRVRGAPAARRACSSNKCTDHLCDWFLIRQAPVAARHRGPGSTARRTGSARGDGREVVVAPGSRRSVVRSYMCATALPFRDGRPLSWSPSWLTASSDRSDCTASGLCWATTASKVPRPTGRNRSPPGTG